MYGGNDTVYAASFDLDVYDTWGNLSVYGGAGFMDIVSATVSATSITVSATSITVSATVSATSTTASATDSAVSTTASTF
jgi:hypothetical protein